MECNIERLGDQADSYEETYRSFIEFFRTVAGTSASEKIIVKHAPWSWVPLLEYLGCECTEPRLRFEHCPIVARVMNTNSGRVYIRDRTTIECLATFRPETNDVLRYLDYGTWNVARGRIKHADRRKFIVTAPGGFARPEVRAYIEKLYAWTPTKRRVVICNCTADKPYPAPLHKKLLEIVPDDYYLMTVTGALSLVPQALWPVMPEYDCGPNVPNKWNVYSIAHSFFARNEHDRIVLACDVYLEPMLLALKSAGCLERSAALVPVANYVTGAVDFGAPQMLDLLKRCIAQFDPDKAENEGMARIEL